MHDIIRNPIADNRHIAVLNPKLTNEDVVHTPFIRRLNAFFDVYFKCSDKSYKLPLTSAGNLKREFCHLYYEAVTGNDRSETRINKEGDYRELLVMRFMLQELDYLDVKKTVCRLTDKGLALRAFDDFVPVYIEFFNFYADYLHWNFLGERFDAEPFSLVQDAALFSLFILREKADGTRSEKQVFEYFRNAFCKDYFNDEDNYLEKIFYLLYETAFFENFCSRFGLTTIEYMPEYHQSDNEDAPVKTTPLFKKLIKWKI